MPQSINTAQLNTLTAELMRRNPGMNPNQAMKRAKDQLMNMYGGNKWFKKVPKQPKPNACFDCEDKLGKEFRIYNDHKYCEQCYLEIRLVCSWCDAKEDKIPEFIETIVEGKDKQVSVILCQKCLSSLERCHSEGCSVLFKHEDESVCENCKHPHCKAHAEAHNCKTMEPTYLWRNASRERLIGDPTKAESIKIPRCVGLELEAVNGKPENLGDKVDRRIGISHDGSLSGDVPLELQTPPASTSELEKIIHNATKALQSVDYEVNKSCGVHIHLDSDDFRDDANKVFHLLTTYYAIEPVLFAMLPKSRRNNKYAQPLRNWIDEPRMMMLSRVGHWTTQSLELEWYKTRRRDDVLNYKQRTKYDSSRYHGFNLHALFKNGHIEYRYHHGSLNGKKITNWINLHLAITEWALNNYKKGVVDAIFFAIDPLAKLRIMVRHMGLSRDTRRYIIKNMKKFASVEEDND